MLYISDVTVMFSFSRLFSVYEETSGPDRDVPHSPLQLSQNRSSSLSYWLVLSENEVRGADECLPLQPSLRMMRFQIRIVIQDAARVNHRMNLSFLILQPDPVDPVPSTAWECFSFMFVCILKPAGPAGVCFPASMESSLLGSHRPEVIPGYELLRQLWRSEMLSEPFVFSFSELKTAIYHNTRSRYTQPQTADIKATCFVSWRCDDPPRTREACFGV